MARTSRKHVKFRVAEQVLVAASILMLLFLLALVLQKEPRQRLDRVDSLSSGWYRMENGEKQAVQLPGEFPMEEEPLELFYDGLTAEQARQVLTTRGAQYDLKISLDEEVLYQYQDGIFTRNQPMKAKQDCDAALPANVEGKTLKLTYYSQGDGQGTYRIPEVYIGSGAAVLEYHYACMAVTMVIVLIMGILSIFAIGVAWYLHRIHMTDSRFLDVAAFLILCGLWCVTDSSIVQQNSPYPSAICVISFYAFMTFSIPMLHFVRNTGEMKKYRGIDYFIQAFYINAVAQGIFSYLHVFPFISMLFVTHILLTLGVVFCSWCMIREYRKKQDPELFTILKAFALLGASGLIALLLYWVLNISFYGVIFECGILIFVILLLSGIVTTMAENLRCKTEMVIYQKLAKEDRLTGLGNRRAYEDLMSEIQRTADTLEDAVLIFMDVNQLKYVNDHYGHNQGDEMIVATARCIESAFGPEGKCFRVGGDEFCVVLLNPKEPQEVWMSRLDRELAVYNSTSRCILSIARGASYLRDKEGRVKRISDWKYQADEKMYEDKGGRRRI